MSRGHCNRRDEMGKYAQMTKDQAVATLEGYVDQIAGGGSRDEFRQALDALASASEVSGAVASSESRDRFEAWVRQRHGESIERWADSGRYRYDNTENWWQCWRTALTSPAPEGEAKLAELEHKV